MIASRRVISVAAEVYPRRAQTVKLRQPEERVRGRENAGSGPRRTKEIGVSHVLEADNFEELAELAVGFLEQDLGGERTVVVHGDEQHASAVVQLFSGFSLKQAERLDAIEWQWQDLVARAGKVVVEPPSGLGKRAVMAAPLQKGSRSASGFLYVERSTAFTLEEQESLQEFADDYLDALWKLSPAIREANKPRSRSMEPPPLASANPLVASPSDSAHIASSLEVLSRLKDVWESDFELPVPKEEVTLRQTVAIELDPMPGASREVAKPASPHKAEPDWLAITAPKRAEPEAVLADDTPWSQFQGRDLEMMLVDWY